MLHLNSFTIPTQLCCFFFFNDTATTEIYTLSLHDALPIYGAAWSRHPCSGAATVAIRGTWCRGLATTITRSEEHTSELQSQSNLVCRLLLEKKKKIHNNNYLFDMSENDFTNNSDRSCASNY